MTAKKKCGEQNMKITEMTTDEILAERKKYEDVIKNCSYETPQEIADLFEAYTMLIWKHNQVGRVYDFYFDKLAVEREGGARTEGSERVVWDTLRVLAEFPDLNPVFVDIHCTGNPKDGFRFGQVLYNEGCAKNGIGPNGAGRDISFEPYEDLHICECWVEFIDGKWRVAKEVCMRSAGAVRRLLGQNS